MHPSKLSNSFQSERPIKVTLSFSCIYRYSMLVIFPSLINTYLGPSFKTLQRALDS